ncbi:hypothetical protein [Marinobacter caseinilyticus]|uniref:hypothetical protein n=1 Tax=Marinobacter caseinilyticus TaxID=2692195 RepID=UPI00140C8962|nr:hypothetical protein [Marinobacter caseinilyticus]
MLYELASPLYTIVSLMVLGGLVYTAKTFVDHKLAQLHLRQDNIVNNGNDLKQVNT